MTYQNPTLKFTLVCFFSLIFFFNANAKGNSGDKFFLQGKYAKAIKKYKVQYAKDPQNFLLVEKIADSYMELDQFSSAEYWYWKAYKEGNLSEEGSFNYMKALLSNSKYHLAEEFCNDHRSKYPNSNFECPNQAKIKDLIFGNKYEVNLTDFNTDGDDLNTTIYQGNLYLISNAEKYTDKLGNLKVVSLTVTDGGNVLGPKVFNKIDIIDPTKGLAFHPFTGEMFYSMKNDKLNNEASLYKSYTNILDVQSTIFQEKLSYANSLAFDIDELTFNTDGSVIYFSSDMAGGYGGTDIWMSTYENGTIGKPVNLGPNINSRGDERYPNLHNGNLYFSSDGLLGLGSFDIFSSSFDGNEWSAPENLKSPINSSFNDYAICFNGANEGFFTSDRIGGKGGNDIYSFSKKPEMMTILVRDKDTKEPLPNTNVTLGNGKVVTTDGAGVCAVEYTMAGIENVTVSLDGYQQNDLKFNQDGYSVVVPMEGQEAIKLMVQVLGKESGLPLEGISVTLNDFQSYSDDAGNTYWMIYPNMDYTLTAYDSKNKSVLNEKLVENFSTVGVETPDFWTATILME